MRKFFSTLLVLIFVPTFSLFLIILSLRFSIFTPDFYKTTFQKANLYTFIIDQYAPALFKTVGEKSSFGLGPLSAEDLTAILKSTVSSQWLQTQTEIIVDGFFTFAYQKSNNLQLIVSLTEFKNNFSHNLTQTLKKKLESLPECTNEQIKQMQAQEDSKAASFDCKLPNMSTEEITKSLTAEITGEKGLLSKLPDQYNFGTVISKTPATSEAIFRFFYFLNLVFWSLLIFSLFLLFLIALLNIKYFPGMLKWISIPLIICSAPILLLGFFGHLLITMLLRSYLTVFPAELSTMMNPLQKIIVSQLFYNFKLYSGLILAGAIIVLILASVLTKKYPSKI